MIANKTIVVNHLETKLIIDALYFVSKNAEFKNEYSVTEDELALVAKKINRQLNPKIKILKSQGIFDITQGWK